MPRTKLCNYARVPDVSVFEVATWDGFDVDAWRARTGNDSGPGVIATCRGCKVEGYAIGQSQEALRHALGDVKTYCKCGDKSEDNPVYSTGDGADGHFQWPDAIAKGAAYVSWTWTKST